ncbi:LADA_0G00870g1_1 [Lachancea dasiensis]|uniref:LADA_0G00870g1_1 n=1 Tax=Lachancea dasiensis TaxID=1072105 RepID=A0A1G4JQI8_9SACH|nr:LADA_0G00870g1_1 [Lachancea dasiensis]
MACQWREKREVLEPMIFWIVKLFVLLLLYFPVGVRSYAEADATSAVLEELGKSDLPVLVMMHMHGCQYCQDLEPNFEYLERVFPERIALLKVDGKRATTFAREMDVRSFPEVLLFDKSPRSPGSEGQQTNLAIKDLYSRYLGRFHGARELGALASFVSQATGIKAYWPDSQVQDLTHPSAHDFDLLWSSENGTICMLVFVTPWMDPEYSKMFDGESSTSLLDRIGESETARSLGLQIFRIDASSASTAEWTRVFRIQRSPTVVWMLPGGDYIRLEWPKRPSELRGRMQEILQTFLTRCIEGSRFSSYCSEYLKSVPGTRFSQSSLNSQLYENETEFDSSFTAFDIEHEELDGVEYGAEDEWLFDSLREI